MSVYTTFMFSPRAGWVDEDYDDFNDEPELLKDCN